MAVAFRSVRVARPGRARKRHATSRSISARVLAAPDAREQDAEPEAQPAEAFLTLDSIARDKTLSIPRGLLVEHVLRVTAGADWPVQRAAMEALLRRCASVEDQELRVAARRPRGGALGTYSTRRARQSPRPYTTVLDSVRPPRGSCDCPDFLKSSLGLCKHLLAVLDSLARQPRRFARLLARAEPTNGGGRARLVWDPVRPLRGFGDWLERVTLIVGDPADSPPAPLARWFRDGRTGGRSLRASDLADSARRAALVQDLLEFLQHDRRGTVGGSAPADPALHRLLVLERERLALTLEMLSGRRHVGRGLRTLRRPLYPYQVEGTHRFLASGRLLLADDMGLGKTVQAIAACHALWHAGKVRRGLLVVPASLKTQWSREWRLFTDAPIEIVDGNQDQRQAFYRKSRSGFLVANYEQVLRDLEAMHTWDPDLVVLDEAQRIKNWSTKTAAYVKQLRPRYRLVLTGTPMENRLDELASIMDWVDEMALEPKWRLAPWHTREPASGDAGGARNLDTVRARLAPCMVRRLRSEVLEQLPSRTDTVIPVELTDEQREAHDELNAPIRRLAFITQRRPLTQAEFLRLMSLLTTQRIIANGKAQLDFATVWPRIAGVVRPDAALLRSLCSPKLVELREIVGQLALQQERKIVVFSQWRRMLMLAHWATRDLLQEGGVRALFFTGAEKQKQRTRSLVEFHDDPAARVLFATDAGGVGLNLQRAASCCINLELPWNPAVLEQRIGRIHRLGQKLPIDVYNLVAQECIESRIAALVTGKRAFFRSLFDGTSDEVRFESSGSFLETLQRIVTPTNVPDLPPSDEAAGEPDPVAEREIEAVVSSADETGDAGVLAAAVLATPGEGAAASVAPAAAEIAQLLAQLVIRPGEQGGIHIEAPPQAAAGLVSLFEGLAGLLRSGTMEAAVSSPAGKRPVKSPA